DGGVARARPVTLGASDAAAVQVISGVHPGDRLIVTGQQTLKDGDPISMAEEAQGAKEAQ
ncbi:MAG TPA: efflux RND transporter periplasmic adaptor subunit, partial [Armatimonadota bacterium]|nr:efflux RND transporter periplasmic adaptor subunit [Armatimonadota bacterium]